MTVEITNTFKGQICVRVPFELKDELKKAFRSAKWDSQSKHWKMGPRTSLERVEQWVEIAKSSGIVEELTEFEARKLADKELRGLEDALQQIHKDIEKRKVQLSSVEVTAAKHETTISAMSEAKNQLEEITHLLRRAQDRKVEAYANLCELIDSIVPISEIHSLMSEMAYWMKRGPKAANRSEFNKSCEKLHHAEIKLAMGGIYSEELRDARLANFNRRDRDLRLLDAELTFTILPVQDAMEYAGFDADDEEEMAAARAKVGLSKE